MHFDREPGASAVPYPNPVQITNINAGSLQYQATAVVIRHYKSDTELNVRIFFFQYFSFHLNAVL